VIIGLVRDTRMIQTNEYDGVWRADVEIQSTLKQDTNLPKRVFIYYEQELRPDSGRRCPPYPQVAIGDKTKFWCAREDIKELKNVLFVPSGSWLRWLDKNFAVRKP